MAHRPTPLTRYRARVTFDRATLETYRDRTIPDIAGDTIRLVFVGINPGLWTAAVGAPFAHPGNRFYRALWEAGITPDRIDATRGLREADIRQLTDRGIALTNLVDRATARAGELDPAELRAGAVRLMTKLDAWNPAVVAMVGITAYRTAFRRPRATVGLQPDPPSNHRWWVVPNPSGLNTHETVASLAAWYRKVADDA